jgi:L-lactate dehydrogenase complex protein LldG
LGHNIHQRSQDNAVITAVRRALGRDPGSPVAPRPPILSPREGGDLGAEIELLLTEIDKLAGQTRKITTDSIDASLAELVRAGQIASATCWRTPWLQKLGIESRLSSLGMEILSPNETKEALARCDLGVTEVDFALPETGTLALISAPDRPRAVSLLPRVHLALLKRDVLRPDMHQLFAEAKLEPYLIFITGPSRTADIELTVTLGVHGPRELHVWVVE